MEAAAALRGVALQRGRVRAAAAASAYPAAAAAAAAAALARPQLTAASLQWVVYILFASSPLFVYILQGDDEETEWIFNELNVFLLFRHRGVYAYDTLLAQAQAQAQAQASDAYRLQVFSKFHFYLSLSFVFFFRQAV